MRLRILAFVFLVAISLPPNVAGAQEGAGLELVGHHDLGRRGMNAALAIGDHCAYIGSRSDAPPLVLDIADPAHPSVVGELAAHPGSTSRELRVAPQARLLAVMHYALGGTTNQIDFYRWGTDCRTPAIVGHYNFGTRRPHEFYLWQDPVRADRLLLFVTTPASTGQNLTVVDASDPESPTAIGSWNLPEGLASGSWLHSISLSDDGRRAYLSLWTGGLLVADSSDFASGSPHPTLRLVTPPAGAYRYPGNVHSAVPVPGRPLVAVTDEEYAGRVGSGCPGGWARVVDATDPRALRLAGALRAPENDPAACRDAAVGTWSSHNPTLTPSLALVSWYSAGLQVFDLSDPARARELAQFRPGGATPQRQDPRLGDTASLAWSYPIVRNGLIYFVDINEGLFVVRYHGPGEEEINRLAFSEGNSNLTREAPALPLPIAETAPPAEPAAVARVQSTSNGVPLTLLPVAVLTALAIALGLALARRR